MSGYVRIHRTLLGHPAFRNDAEAMAFAWLVARAQWKPARVRYKDRRLDLGRGQVVISVRDFAGAMDRDKAWVERLLKRLKAETMIETRIEAGLSVITVCNYSQYQADRDTSETQGEAPAKTGARQARDTEQEGEKGKKGNKPAPKRVPRPTFDIPDWVPAEPWAAFDAMRKRKKAPIDGYIADRLFETLSKAAAEGWDIAKVLDKATVNNWTDLYIPTPGRDDAMRASKADETVKGQFDTPEAQAAFLAKIAEKPWSRPPDRPPDRPAAFSQPPRSIGQLAKQITQDQAT